MKIRLHIELPDSTGFDWTCNETTVELGRDPACRLSFPSTGSNVVSGRHARLELSSGGLLLRDMNSANGTFVNGAPVQGAQALRTNDRVQLGQTGPTVVVVWFDQMQSVPNQFAVPVAQAIHAAPAAPTANHQSSSSQLTPLNAVLTAVAVLSVIVVAVVLAQSNGPAVRDTNGDAFDSLKEQLKMARDEKDAQAKKLEALETQLRSLESDRARLEQENGQLKQKAVFTEKWRRATFYVTDKKSCAIAVQASPDGDIFRVLDKTEHEWVDYAVAVCTRFQIPAINGASALARQIHEAAIVGQSLDGPLSSLLAKHWNVKRFVPFAPEQSPEFVAFFDTTRRCNRVGFFLNASTAGLEFYPVGRASEIVSAQQIDPSSVRKGTADQLSLEPEIDFLDLCALQIAHALGTPNEDDPKSVYVVIDQFEPDWLEEFIGLSKEPDINWNDFFFDFVARAQLEEYRPDSRKKEARELRVAIQELKDSFSKRLVRLKVPSGEREHRKSIQLERDLAKNPEFEQRQQAKQRVATHKVIGDVGKPMGDGRWRFSVRLVETDTNDIIFEDHCDIGRRIPQEVGTFFLDSGRVAAVKKASKSPPALLYYVETGANENDYFLRDLFSQELRLYPFGSDIQLDYNWFPLQIPPRQRMNALMWQLARHLLPRGGRVEKIRGQQAQISLGSDADIYVGARCKVWRVANHTDRQFLDIKDWRILPIEVSVSEVIETKAKAAYAQSGLEALWPDVGPLEIGDIVVRKDARTPFVAICPFQFAEDLIDRDLTTKINALRKNRPGYAQQLKTSIENATKGLCLEMESFLTKQNVHCSDPISVARLGGGDFHSPPLVSRQLGISHVIYGAIAPDSADTAELKIKIFLRILDVENNKIVLTLTGFPLTVEQIERWPAMFREPPSNNWIFPIVDKIPGYNPVR